MPIQRLCTIVEATKLNAAAYSFTLEAGEMAETARVGQFVHVSCGEGLLLRRPISICDIAGSRLRLVFELRGEGTAWLARRRVGESLDLLGPLGHGFDLLDGNVLLVGGGLGVPPLLACAVGCGGKATAVLGFRSQDRAMLVADFEKSCKAVCLCSDDGTIGNHGYVDAQLQAQLSKNREFTAVLACGPKPMLRAVAQVAARFGVPCQVSMEERMGCGVGACLVCACKTLDGRMKHVCKDGPVFNAGEVDWND